MNNETIENSTTNFLSIESPKKMLTSFDINQNIKSSINKNNNIMISPVESPLVSPIVERTKVPEISVYPKFNLKKTTNSESQQTLQSSNTKKFNIIATPIESPLESPIVEKTKVPEISIYPKFNLKFKNKENPPHDRKFLEIKTQPIPKEITEPLSTEINKPLPFEVNSVVEVKFPLKK
jgi:hypothetical protein